MALRKVEIIVTSAKIGTYEARSYPDEQMDAAGFYNLYKVPIYRILVVGTDVAGKAVSVEFMAPRFMPYFNDPRKPSPHYSTLGWVNAGLTSARKVTITQYKKDYRVQNRFSPGIGAIVVHKSFYIHAGPASLADYGFGSAGCVEIIGNYDDFKSAMARLSGSTQVDPDAAITQLVGAGKLIVTIEQASAPDIKSSFTRKVRDY